MSAQTILRSLVTLTCVLLVGGGIGPGYLDCSAAAVPYQSYRYDFWRNADLSPDAYVPSRVVDGSSLDCGNLRDPQDLFVSDDGTIWVADTGNNRVVRLDREFRVQSVISQFVSSGVTQSFSAPSGLFVTSEGYIFVADLENQRVAVLNEAGEFIREIVDPRQTATDIIASDYEFLPEKVGVDGSGRTYVISRNQIEGIATFDGDGIFRGFIGAPRVTPSIADYFWSRIRTREQRERMSLFLPTRFSSLDIDARGFVYATVPSGETTSDTVVKKLSGSGQDVLVRNGYYPPVGDVAYPEFTAEMLGPSVLKDIVVQDNGTYSVLDQRRGRVFTYDNLGNLLYVFGGMGPYAGLVETPTAIDVLDDRMLVLDAKTGAITEYTQTEYCKLILLAISLYNHGRYEESSAVWKEVLGRNVNNEMAYIGIGHALFMNGEFSEAMEFFRLGNYRHGYSKAFRQFRKDLVSSQFSKVMLVFGAILLLRYAIPLIRRRTRKKGPASGTAVSKGHPAARSWLYAYSLHFWSALRYTAHVIIHPIEGFTQLKSGGRGNSLVALVILAAVTASFVFARQGTGFLFNERDLTQFNLLMESAAVIIPVLLWCIVNWMLTTLMDGKGSFRDIFIASTHALIPLLLFNVPLTVVSNYLVLEEASFYHLLSAIGVTWAGVLMIIGTMIIHEYSFGKTLVTSALTGVGIGVTVFGALLGVSVIEHVFGFIHNVYTELVFRVLS